MNEDDWLKVETPDDWLSTEPACDVPDISVKPGLTALPAIPDTSSAKLEQLTAAWDRLMPKQKAFLGALRETGWNQRAALRVLEITPYRISRSSLRHWIAQDDYGFCFKVLQAEDAGTVLDKDKLLLRQDSIVEQLLTPTPILHQGAATGYFENRAPAASKANEVLMKAAGLLKNDEHATRHVVRFVNLAGPELQTAIEVATEII